MFISCTDDSDYFLHLWLETVNSFSTNINWQNTLQKKNHLQPLKCTFLPLNQKLRAKWLPSDHPESNDSPFIFVVLRPDLFSYKVSLEGMLIVRFFYLHSPVHLATSSENKYFWANIFIFRSNVMQIMFYIIYPITILVHLVSFRIMSPFKIKMTFSQISR